MLDHESMKVLLMSQGIKNDQKLSTDEVNFTPGKHMDAEPAPKKARKIKWQVDDDVLLIHAINLAGQNWPTVSKLVPGKTARQCRDRYQNVLSKQVDKSPFSPDEDALLLKLVQEHGQRFEHFTKYFSHRPGIALKNRYATLIAPKKPGRSKPQPPPEDPASPPQ